MNGKNTIKFNDNVRVATRKWGAEFLALVMRESDEHFHQTVSLTRYCVPGRIDSYRFEYVPANSSSGMSGRLVFSTEALGTRAGKKAGLSLPQAMKMLAADLKKEQVVSLIRSACSRPEQFWHSMNLVNNLLGVVAPQSKAYRAARKAVEKVRKERTERMKAGTTGEKIQKELVPA